MPSLYPEIVPVLTDGEVTLRALGPADVPALAEQGQDPQMVRWTTVPHPYGRDDAEAFLDLVERGWADDGNRVWAVEAADGRGASRFAGTISCRPAGDGIAEVGFGLHPAARGHGLMTRALRLMLCHAFHEGGLEVVHWRAAAGNWASRRTAWACGFRVEGTVRGFVGNRRGERYDAWVGSLRKGDPLEPAHPWRTAPTLEGPTLRLRPWREDDAPTPEQGPDEDSLRFMPAGAQPTAAAFPAWLLRARSRMADGTAIHWCIADCRTDAALGNVQVFDFDDLATPTGAALGYWLYPTARGRGVMAETMDLVLTHAFASAGAGGLGLHRLHATTDAENVASQRVLRRAGFRLTGDETDSMHHDDGTFSGGRLFELLGDHRGGPRVPEPTRLEGERVVLREWRDTDLPRLVEALSEPARREALGLTGPRATETEALDWLARRFLWGLRGERVTWCVADRGDDRAVGTVTLYALGHEAFPGSGEIGYWVHPDERGRGLANEALDLLVPYLLTPGDEGGLGLGRLRAHADETNVASQVVLRRAGFMEWGREPGGLKRADGTVGAVVHFALGRADDRIAAAILNEATALSPEPLVGAGVNLRPLRDDDARRIVEACSDEASRHWLATLPADYSAGHAHDYLRRSREQAARGTGLYWGVADPATDLLLGVVALMDLAGDDSTSAEVGYWLHPDARGRGAMTEAVRLAVRHAFVPREDGGLGRRRLSLMVADGNDASRAVARRAGFVEVGRDRLAEPLGDGSFADLVRYDLLEREYDRISR